MLYDWRLLLNENSHVCTEGEFLYVKKNVPYEKTKVKVQVDTWVSQILTTGRSVSLREIMESLNTEMAKQRLCTLMRLISMGFLDMGIVDEDHLSDGGVAVKLSWNGSHAITVFNTINYLQGGWRLRRFNVSVENNSILVESSAGASTLVINDFNWVQQLMLLASFKSAADFLSRQQDQQSSIMLLDLLRWGGLLENNDIDSFADWEWHDRCFFQRTRLGFGRMRHGKKVSPADQVLRAPSQASADAITLPLVTAPPAATLAECANARSSAYIYRPEQMPVELMAQWLQYSLRSGAVKAPKNQPHRLYPSGGTLYAVKAYMTLANISGIRPGLYYYNPDAHCLELCHLLNQKELDRCNSIVSGAMGLRSKSNRPHGILHMAADMAYIQENYHGLCMSLVLKESGAVTQQLYLAAAAFGVNVCAVGTFDAEYFAKLCEQAADKLANVAEVVFGW